jgi:hypothetical protein
MISRTNIHCRRISWYQAQMAQIDAAAWTSPAALNAVGLVTSIDTGNCHSIYLAQPDKIHHQYVHSI